MSDFAEALRWTTADDGVCVGTVPPDWMQGRATFGGLVAGIGLEAMRRDIPPERAPRVVHTAFFGPLGAGEARAKAQIMRAGRSVTHARAEIVQGGTARAQVTAAFGADRPSDLIVEAPARPDLPPPESVGEMPYLEGLTPSFTQHFQYRYANDGFPFSGGKSARIEGWIRHRGPGGPPHASIMALLDAWPCPILCIARRRFPASTVSWTTTFAHVPEAIDPDGWWGFTSETVQSGGGHVSMRGALYAPDGRLAAIEDQLVVVFDKVG